MKFKFLFLVVSPDGNYVISYDQEDYTLNNLSFLGKLKIHSITGKLIADLEFSKLSRKSGLNKIKFTPDDKFFAIGFIVPDESNTPEIKYYILNDRGKIIKNFSLISKKVLKLEELESVELNFDLLVEKRYDNFKNK